MGRASIFSDFLRVAGVPHTQSYSDRRFEKMPFRTMFGLSKLLEEYGVSSAGIMLGDKSEMTKLPLPFIAQTPDGYVIVKAFADDKVSYLTQGVDETVLLSELENAMTGAVLVVQCDGGAKEPGYASHRFSEIAIRAKKWLLVACCLILLAWGVCSNRIYTDVSMMLLTVIGIAGIYVTDLLVSKSAHLKSRHADAVCAVVQAGGCDDVLATSAAKFFGVFGWSEVGFAYFSVSLVCLLVFPEYTGCLAAFNVLCLPFSFWSVWYQKFRARKWCTLCLCVQSMLWLSFFCYLGGGWLNNVFPLSPQFFIIGVCYLAVMLGLNAIMPLIDRSDND